MQSNIMRNLWVNRSNQPQIASLSELFLSLATGLIIVLHSSWLGPLLAEPYNNLQSAMFFLVLVVLFKTLILFCILKGPSSSPDSDSGGSFLSKRNFVYPGMIRAGAYLSLVVLTVGNRSLSVTIVTVSTLGFVLWLAVCAKENGVAKRVEKGRHYSKNPLKVTILYTLALAAVGLQPQQYSFAFKLHFQIFIIFVTSLLAFSYFYAHRITLIFASKDRSYYLLSWSSFFELLSLLFAWLYFFFMEQQGLPLSDQFDYLLRHWWMAPLMALFSTIYELALWEHIRKVALSQLALTLSTGLIWFNIYQMAVSEINLRLYASVVLMGAVLLANIGLCSEVNCRRVQKGLSGKPRKRKKGPKRDSLSGDE